MKKLFISLLALAATVNVMALNVENQAKITITGGTATHSLYLINASDLAEGYNNGYCGEIYDLDGHAVAIYAIFNEKNYETFGSKNLMEQPIQFAIKTNGSDTYTLKVEKVKGEPMKIAFGSKVITLAEGTYTLTAAEAAEVGEFYEEPAAPYSFINNVLVINEATEGAEITITPFTYGAEGKNLGTPAIYNAPVNQVLNGGYFLVTYTNAEGVAREFIVNANPDVQPAND